MNPQVERALTLARAVGREVRIERITFMAGSIAYNAFVSLLPLLLLLVTVVSTVGDRTLRQSLLGITDAALTPGASDVLIAEVQRSGTELSLLGGVFLVWGSLRIFRSLDAAFSDIYETSAENSFADQLADGFVVFVSMVAVVMVAVALESQLSTVAGTDAGWFAQRLVLVAGVAAALFPMYYLFPDESGMSPLEVVPGVAVTAVGLVAFQSLFQLYLAFSSTAARESILASILVFMTWLYFSGLIILLGGAVNAVLSNRSQDVNVEPVLGGVPLDEERAVHGGEGADEETVATLERLGDTLPAATDVAVVVDGETVDLPTPERAETDLDTSRLPFVADTVTISLTWSGEELGDEEG